MILPGNNTIDITSLPAGIFILELSIEKEVFKTKFVSHRQI